jgi:heme/copper-type cytochrome/quinol oxidase subunit 3
MTTAMLTERPPRSTAWWGMVVLIMTEAAIFASLLSAYFYLRAASPTWPQGQIEPPELARAGLFSIALLGSSIPVALAERALRRDRMRVVRSMLGLSFVLGAVFLANQLLEYRDLGFGLRDNAYASLFYVITGLHGLHVAIGLVISIVVQLKAWMNKVDSERHLTVSVFGLYWHFVDAVWIFVFSSLYLSAHVR